MLKQTKDEFDKSSLLYDYYMASLSRQLSVQGRKEVLSGKAKFGVFGDGKELAQIAMAKCFRLGDWRAGYYRDQTFMLYAGLLTPDEFFSQLYGDTNMENNPGSSGRAMNNHFATANYSQAGKWLNLMELKNSSSDISPTAGQMPRLLGLAYASKLFRLNSDLHHYTHLTNKGNEVAFGTIGDASTSEGHFFETMNAAGVLQVPMAIAVWDDGFGISVPTGYQTTKLSISEVMKGFESDPDNKGILIYKAKGWNYPELCRIFHEGINRCRSEHIPVLFHIQDMTQPSGHTTSGSHERYKSSARLEWEHQFDPIKKMKEWLLETQDITIDELSEIDNRAVTEVKLAHQNAWKKYTSPFLDEKQKLLQIIDNKTCTCKKDNFEKLTRLVQQIRQNQYPIKKDLISTAKKLIRNVCFECASRDHLKENLADWIHHKMNEGIDEYSSKLYNETEQSALNVKECKPVYNANSPLINGREIIRDNFESLFKQYPLLVIFGEDVGMIGGVNQTYEGLQEKFGDLRIMDTGIRETSIAGQGIGLALRGFRPIAEIQYFDYLIYTIQTLSDDLATTHWRTKGNQIAPMILTTRGHRLEGVWHAGSPMSMLIGSVKGMYVCVPRNMTQAAGFYNTLLKGEDPAIVIEPLNAYRLKESRPDNIGQFTVPLGIPEVLIEGSDLTLVTYGSCVRIAQQAVEELREFNIYVELIDVQTLIPFDIHHTILTSIKKTNRIIFLDEDVPGGATAYMMHKVLEEQMGYYFLDSEPRTLTGRDHRPAYSTDGDYFSNPNAENIFELVYSMMHEASPHKWPSLY